MTERAVVSEIISKNFSTLDSVLSSKLQDKAIKSGWPVTFANVLYIENGEVKYPQEYAKEVEDLEYGTPDSPPNPFLRTYKENEVYNEMYENLLIELLFDSEVLF